MAETTSDDLLEQIVKTLLSRQGGGNVLTDTSTVLGNAASGRAAGVNAENMTALGAGDLSNRLFQSAMQRQLAQTALPNFRAQQAVTGDQIANTQDVVPTGPANVMAHVVNFTGGRRPSNLGPNARSAGAALSNLGASNIGKDVLPEVPAMPKMSNGGVLGNILGGGALGAGLLGALLPKGGSNSGMDLGKTWGDLRKLFSHQGSGDVSNVDTNMFGGQTNAGGGYGPDPFDLGGIGPDEQYGSPQDPSGGSGIGPGMQDYYEWLKLQGGGGTGGGSDDEGGWGE